MSYIIITTEITSYLPKSFNFEDFKFKFNHDNQSLDDEISFISKNKITHKIELSKKDIIFSVKVFKKDSLIGKCDYIIPYKSILLKKVPIYEKECIINIINSKKRILSIHYFNLKVNIQSEIKYIDNEKEENNKRLFVKINNKIKDSQANKNYNNIKIYHKNLNNNNKKIILEKNKQNININRNNKIYNKPINHIHKKLNIKLNEIYNKEIYNEDNSFDTEEELEKNIEIKDNEFSNYVHNLLKENPLENLDKMENVDEMLSFTKDNILKFLDFQQDFNNKIRRGIYACNHYYKLLKKYSQKYANNLKKIQILEKKQKISEIEKLINTNSLISNIFRIVEIKNNENELFKEITDYNSSEDSIQDNLNINEIYEDKNIKYNKKYNLLNRLLNNCIENYGKNDRILTLLPKNILEKYNFTLDKNEDLNNNIFNDLDISLVDNDENDSNENNENTYNKELDYVESSINDEIDFELDNNLKEFYKNYRNIPVIKFKKIHDNNYKYGDTQIIIIEEGDKIKIKDDKGIFTLDEYIQLNSKN